MRQVARNFLNIPAFSPSLALLQAQVFLYFFNEKTLSVLSVFGFATNIIVIAAGSVLLMWLGELITEFGVGNGVSLIIFAGIIADFRRLFPESLRHMTRRNFLFISLSLLWHLSSFTLSSIVTEAERPVPVTYAKQVRGQKVYGGVSTYIPLRVNQAGVIPIIFALSILLFPQMIFNFLASSANAVLQKISIVGLSIVNNHGSTIAVISFSFLFSLISTRPSLSTRLLFRKIYSEAVLLSLEFVPDIRPRNICLKS